MKALLSAIMQQHTRGQKSRRGGEEGGRGVRLLGNLISCAARRACIDMAVTLLRAMHLFTADTCATHVRSVQIDSA